MSVGWTRPSSTMEQQPAVAPTRSETWTPRPQGWVEGTVLVLGSTSRMQEREPGEWGRVGGPRGLGLPRPRASASLPGEQVTPQGETASEDAESGHGAVSGTRAEELDRSSEPARQAQGGSRAVDHRPHTLSWRPGAPQAGRQQVPNQSEQRVLVRRQLAGEPQHAQKGWRDLPSLSH